MNEADWLKESKR